MHLWRIAALFGGVNLICAILLLSSTRTDVVGSTSALSSVPTIDQMVQLDDGMEKDDAEPEHRPEQILEERVRAAEEELRNQLEAVH